MDESKRDGPSAGWRWVRIMALCVVMFSLTLILLGYVLSALKQGRRVDITNPFAIGFTLALLGCGWLLVRQIRTPTGEDPLTRQERLNRNFHVASGFVVIVLVVAMSFTGESGWPGVGALSNDPLSPVAAILAILVFGVLLPAISLYWHRIIDEQEADAYKTGALFALYVFAIGAPVWWLAWRGGFVPPPDGFVIYFVTIMVASAIWFWKKYR